MVQPSDTSLTPFPCTDVITSQLDQDASTLQPDIERSRPPWQPWIVRPSLSDLQGQAREYKCPNLTCVFCIGWLGEPDRSVLGKPADDQSFSLHSMELLDAGKGVAAHMHLIANLM